MKVIILGISGLIGSYLAKRFQEKNYRVLGVSRNPDKIKDKQENIEYIQWDGETLDLKEEITLDTAIINLVGESLFGFRWTKRKKKRIIESRVKSATAVSKLAKYKPKVIIQISGLGYYGNTKNETITEKAQQGDSFLGEVCKVWEEPISTLESQRCVIMRLAIVLTKEGGALKMMSLPFKFLVGGKLGNGKQFVPWIHIEDIFLIMSEVIVNQKYSGIYNICSPTPVTNKEFTKTLGKVLKRPSFVWTPGLAMKLMLGEMGSLVLEGQKAIPQRLHEMKYEFKYAKLEDALHEVYRKE